MSEFVEATSIEKLPPGQGMTVTVNGKDIALFNVDGNVHAIDDGCVHAGASLGSSKFQGKIVTCRAHGWKFDVTTGNVSHVPDYGVGCYQVKIEDGKVLVAVPHL